jgi:triosephosphate isomerase
VSRRPLIAGNWKLHLGPGASAALSTELRSVLASRGDVDVAVFPTAISICTVLTALEGSGIEVGIQEIHNAPTGAFTGANSAVLAREAGCTRFLVGHSERRHLFGETDAGVARKVKAGLAAGMLPVLCVGETLDERDAGHADAVVHLQLEAALADLEPDQIPAITLAYEPVWAIGTGRTATPEQAQAVHASVRAWLSAHYPAFVARSTRILYGGSVNATNAAALLACPDIDGALVGGASLKPAEFAATVHAAGR